MAEEEKEDRISLLPDFLLLEIISRIKIIKVKYERIMTTKDVIRTTATLSKRWQHLWTRLPNLIFIDKNDVKCKSYNTDLTDYFSSIGQTLTQYSTDVNLNKLTLHFKEIYDSKVNVQLANSCICHAINCKVQQVDFTLYEFGYDDDLFFNNSCFVSMKLSKCLLNPSSVISWENLKSLCISRGKLDEDMIEKILSGCPCLETLELKSCHGFSRIAITSKSVKNLVFFMCSNWIYFRNDCIDTIEIRGMLSLEKLLLLNVSSIVKADLDYTSYARWLLRREYTDREDIEMLKEFLQSLGHVNKITPGSCLKVLSHRGRDNTSLDNSVIFGSLFDWVKV
ncbi:F-box/LRR-repeat protein 25-like protein [Tanacetum coccineum]